MKCQKEWPPTLTTTRMDSDLSSSCETISDLTRKPPLRTAPPHVDNKPVQARWDRDGHYIIGCEDCLREFSVPRALQHGAR